MRLVYRNSDAMGKIAGTEHDPRDEYSLSPCHGMLTA